MRVHQACRRPCRCRRPNCTRHAVGHADVEDQTVALAKYYCSTSSTSSTSRSYSLRNVPRHGQQALIEAFLAVGAWGHTRGHWTCRGGISPAAVVGGLGAMGHHRPTSNLIFILHSIDLWPSRPKKKTGARWAQHRSRDDLARHLEVALGLPESARKE